MKTLYVITFVLSLVLSACGSSTPFARGTQSLGDNNRPTEKVTQLDKEFYNQKVQSLLGKSCASCHNNPAPTYELASQFVVPGQPQRSILYLAALGTKHAGGMIWSEGSSSLLTLKQWINGQRLTTPTEPPPPTTPPVPEEPNPAEGLNRTYFEQKVLPMLENRCSSCHDNPAPTYDLVTTLVKSGDITQSILFLKASGVGHRKILKENSEELNTLKSWIEGSN